MPVTRLNAWRQYLNWCGGGQPENVANWNIYCHNPSAGY